MQYRKLNDQECELCEKQFARNKVHESIATQSGVNCNTMIVAYHVDDDQKFTCCTIIKNGRGRNNRSIHLGASKRLTKQPRHDEYNEEVGNSIAFTRALLCPPIRLPNGKI